MAKRSSVLNEQLSQLKLQKPKPKGTLTPEMQRMFEAFMAQR